MAKNCNRVFSLVLLMTLASFNANADGKKGDGCSVALGEAKVEVSENTNVEATSTVKAEKSASSKIKVYKVSSFMDKDPSKNIAQLHPSVMMNAAEKLVAAINAGGEPRRVLDPVYKGSEVMVYPAFTGGIPGVKRTIIGQYKPIEKLVDYLNAKAAGNKGGKMPLLVGPSGTGKTEVLSIIAEIRNVLMDTNPDFEEYTFEWKGLGMIDSLSGVYPPHAKGKPNVVTPADIKRSPFTLLRSDMQKEVLANAGQRVTELTGYKATGWTKPDPKNGQILQKVFEFEINNIGSKTETSVVTTKGMSKEDISLLKNPDVQVTDKMSLLTEADYLAVVDKYVRVIKKKVDLSAADGIVRARPDTPDMGAIFARENMLAQLSQDQTSPLAYMFTGEIFQMDGHGLNIDEAFRNDPALLDVLLELAQNNVAAGGVAPPVVVDTVPILTTNDESIEDASGKGPLNAFIDRTTPHPMRSNLHPNQVAKLALLMVKASQFEMRKLGTDENGNPFSNEPLDLQKAYPEAEADGSLKGADGRYAIYYAANPNQKILVAPRTLYMLGLVATTTRLNFDQNKIKKLAQTGEIQAFGPNSSEYFGPVERLNVILGNTEPLASVRKDLDKLRYYLKEGEVGISARSVQDWMAEALSIAAKNKSPLTPAVLDQAFTTLMKSDGLKAKNDNTRAQWLRASQIIKSEFILPALEKDIQQIISGEGKRAERIYDAIEMEIVTLQQNPEAKVISPDGGGRTLPIERARLEAVKKEFLKVTGREFQAGLIMSNLQANAVRPQGADRTRDHQLLKAIESYVAKTTVETAENADRISKYFYENNGDAETIRIVEGALANAAALGYDEYSFKEALEFYKNLVYQRSERTAQQQ